MKRSALHDILVFQEIKGVVVAVPFRFLDVQMVGAVLRGFNYQIFTIFKMYYSILKKRCAHNIFVATGTNGIET